MILNEYTTENILQEQYYGKNKQLEEVDKLFDRAIEIVNMKGKSLSSKGYNEIHILNKDIAPKMEVIIRNLFNFKNVYIEFCSIGSVNAYTVTGVDIAGVIKGDPKYMKVMDKNGVRYKVPYNNLHVVISTEIMSLDDMTGPIMTSCLLHEIGHNFFFESGVMYAFSQLNYFINLLIMCIQNPASIPSTIKQIMLSSSKNLRAAVDKLTKELSRLPIIGSMVDVIESFTGSIKTITNNMMVISSYLQPYATIIGKTAFALASVITSPITRPAYRNEQFADNFATAYGYGKEVIQLQEIASKTNGYWTLDIMGKNAFFAEYFDLMANIGKAFGGFDDIHPSTVSRIIDQIDYLEAQSKNIKDKKMQNKIKKDLSAMKKEYAKLEKDLKDGKYDEMGKVYTSANMQNNIKNKGDLAYKTTKKGRNGKGQWDALPDQI